MIPSPTVLATLPIGGKSQDCAFRTAAVQSLALTSASQKQEDHNSQASVRRKQRSEVVIACPSGAIQIYDIRTARQITSYTSPPGSGFECKPCSVIFRSATNGVKRRVTVAALRGTTGKGKGKIVLWEEQIGRDVPLKEKIRMFQHEADVEDIVKLDISLHRNVASHEEYQIIGIGRRGRICSWSEKLQHEFLGDGSLNDVEITESFLIGMEQAKEGILKNRDDISAIAAARRLNEVLVSLTTTQAKSRKESQTLSIHLHGLRSLSDQTLASNVKDIVSLGSATLPHSPAGDSLFRSHFFLNAGSLLFSTTSDHLAIFDLSRIAPILKTSSRIQSLSSMIPMSECIVAFMDDRCLNVLDTRYNAILASRPLDLGEKLNGMSNGVNGSHAKETNSFELVGSFPDTETLCAIQGNTLVTFQIEGDEKQVHPRKKLKHATLADAVGRGLGITQDTSRMNSNFHLSSEIGAPESPQPLDKSWDAEAKELEEFAREGDSKGFDKLARSCFGQDAKGQRNSIHPRKVDHILGLLFASTAESTYANQDAIGRTLNSQVWPGKTMDYLSKKRLVSQSAIEGAMKRTGRLGVVERLHPTAVVTAMAHANLHTMKKLKTLLNLATSVDTREAMCAIRLALQRLQQQQNLEQMQLLTAGPAENGDAMEQDEPPPANTPKHIPYAHDVIRLSLDRLQLLHPSTYASAMAAEFSPAELFALIDYLRLAMAQRGWFARHTDPVAVSSSGSLDLEESESKALVVAEPGAPNPGLSSTAPAPASERDTLTQSAQLAVTLLNTALDTLGTQGWLLTEQGSAAAILGHMRVEVSAALEGVEEAAYLQGLLAEMLHFAASVPQSALTPKPPNQQRKGVLIETVASGSDKVDEARSLPLGLRYVHPGGPGAGLDADTLNRHKNGGEIAKRSKRDKGRQMSMRVGVHSFERIVL